MFYNYVHGFNIFKVLELWTETALICDSQNYGNIFITLALLNMTLSENENNPYTSGLKFVIVSHEVD